VASQRAFFGVSALLFAASAAATIVWCASTPAMGGMPMPGQTWSGAGAAFLGMWVVMMAAMMLPSLVPMLSRYRQAVGVTGEKRLGALTALVGAGYLFAWAVYGAGAYALGTGVKTLELRLPGVASIVPMAAGVVLLVAGSLQLTAWKVRQVARCWEALACADSARVNARGAWHQGLWLGAHCGLCCSAYMILLLLSGMMNLGVMALVAAAITIERVSPAPRRVARAAGVVIILTGAVLLTSPG